MGGKEKVEEKGGKKERWGEGREIVEGGEKWKKKGKGRRGKYRKRGNKWGRESGRKRKVERKERWRREVEGRWKGEGEEKDGG